MEEITFRVRHPTNPKTGEEWDQTQDAANNMRHAYSLQLPELKRQNPRMGRAIIVGGAPSIGTELENIRKLSADPDNALFALNMSHNWLIDRRIIPYGCVLFEIDTEPDELFAAVQQDVTYFICSHCHSKTFSQLEGHKRVLWHCQPNSAVEAEVAKELYPKSDRLGGGIGTFLRTLSVALALGFRNIDLFGCDSSFPDDSPSTHVEGYKTPNNVETEAFYMTAQHTLTGKEKKFKTVGYLAYQVKEFERYCEDNHWLFAMRVHGDSLLRFTHESIYPDQYERT